MEDNEEGISPLGLLKEVEKVRADLNCPSLIHV